MTEFLPPHLHPRDWSIDLELYRRAHEVAQQADTDKQGLSRTQTEILLTIVRYWEGVDPLPETNIGEGRRIGRGPPPDLHQMWDISYSEFESEWRVALKNFHERDILREESICRTQIQYGLTPKGRKFLIKILNELCEDIFYLDDEYPLSGDPNELLTHRFCVMTTATHYMTWKEEKVKDVELYPGGGSRVEPDVYIPTTDVDYAAEVYTGHGGYKENINKYEQFARRRREKDVAYIWVLPTAELAARWINVLQNEDIPFECPNAPFSNPENYRLNRLRDYLTRSEAYTPGMATVTTPTHYIENVSTREL
jgi:hypothetical protein